MPRYPKTGFPEKVFLDLVPVFHMLAERVSFSLGRQALSRAFLKSFSGNIALALDLALSLHCRGIALSHPDDDGPFRRRKLGGFDGISLLEVLNLTYLGRDEIEPQKQLGSIELEFDSGSKKIYYQRYVVKSNPTIKFGDTIFLTDKLIGPICSLNELDMQFNLFLGAYKGSLKLKFEPYQNRVWFEERKIRAVDGTGLIHVVFGCLSNATVANLKINISGATNVHGIIAARNSQLKNPACTSVLLWKSPANEIEVGCDGVIPLFKSRVGVPLVSVLYVDIALYIDGEIYTDTVSFVPQIAGEKLENLSIPNKETKIGVQVKWDSRKNSIYSTYHSLYWEREDEYDSDEDEYDSDENTEG
ncbi:hypothetical protein POM88_024140 [Heracleum sosnowskyi]|uniref:DUF6598 domain-containing protein n=1 Tax=Heracleum sosnowskyi TaxID=360622 RepID=A0AAD8I2K8_9APIA|nr:hypothetical protein POM88_024140 [Heracleum sosnowskyi]